MAVAMAVAVVVVVAVGVGNLLAGQYYGSIVWFSRGANTNMDIGNSESESCSRFARKPAHTWHQARPRAVWERASNRGEWPFLYKRTVERYICVADARRRAGGQHGCSR